MRSTVGIVLLAVACATHSGIRQIERFRDAKERGDLETAKRFIAPGARIWFEEKKGEGEPFGVGGGSWDHWDHYFRSRTTLSGWKQEGRVVTATANETNDFMRLLEWQPKPYTVTYWLDDRDRIESVLIKSSPGKAVSRLDEFKAWARTEHPEELAYLMPKDRLDPTGDRPERWRAILEEWRKGNPANVE